MKRGQILEIWPKKTNLAISPSPRGAQLPQTKLQVLPNWIIKHYKSGVFIKFHNLKPPEQT